MRRWLGVSAAVGVVFAAGLMGARARAAPPTPAGVPGLIGFAAAAARDPLRASRGWDYVTGRGTPQVAKIVQDS